MAKPSWYLENLMNYTRIENYIRRNQEELRVKYDKNNLALICLNGIVRVYDFDKSAQKLGKRIYRGGINQSNLVVIGTIDQLVDRTPKIFSFS
jgi:hypothetical protein